MGSDWQEDSKDFEILEAVALLVICGQSRSMGKFIQKERLPFPSKT